ncbi:MAG: glutamate synthase large subunit [Candidatus Omnitrophota bacterium]|nr:glutamate synthase large subunit [Candidatus Omnitrophota bacterium]
MKYSHFPLKQGLYDPRFEHDSCGAGFVCDIKGRPSNDIVKKGLEVLRRMSHRGATGADPKTGDGAGLLIQIPHEFFLKACRKSGVILPERGHYGTGLIFLPTDPAEKEFCKKIFKKLAEEEGQVMLGWRVAPVDDSEIGKTARETKPSIEQVFIGRSGDIKEEIEFERRLYIIRKRIESSILSSRLKKKSSFYITNISCRTFSYKGLLMPSQLGGFFADLKDEDLKSAICLVHSRYSTNTFPTWDLAQPFRFLAHNGEINTLRGNINWMRAREGLLESPYFGKKIDEIKPVIMPGGSDSAAIDNIFELLVLAGRSLTEAVTMLIPMAWEKDDSFGKGLRDFYLYRACLMEPWDGPAAIAFTDGKRVGAILDRNGLRPARYVITKNDLIVMASEAGVLDITPGDILISGRLEPGKILFIDTEEKRIIKDEEIKIALSAAHPYDKWIEKSMVNLDDLPPVKAYKRYDDDILILLKAFGYTREDLKFIVKPMAEKANEPIGSMGNDTPHAVLSERPQLIYSYFKQLFAQVTNPAIDPIREEIVMSMESYVGPQKNILEDMPDHCHRLLVKDPILTDEDLGKIRNISVNGFRTKTISTLFKISDEKGFTKALARICREAAAAIKNGYSFIILSDRNTDSANAALPALLAVGALHHSLVRNSTRTRIGIIVESAEPREVHHFALLFGYGADCVNPYFAYRVIGHMVREGELELKTEMARENYKKAASKGVLKILSKMGISTLQSYRGAQAFEALGLSDEVMEKCFTGTPSRIGGAGFGVIAEETLLRHKEAYPDRGENFNPNIAAGGVYQWKKDGEYHLWNPESIALLQDSVRSGDYRKYKEFARLINDQTGRPATLRSLFQFTEGKAIPIEEVESAERIIKRFVTGAMSFGSISKAAHETLAIAMNRMGAQSNTGEGGEDPARFTPLANGDSKRSAIKQVASGRFGVTINYLVNADELQIKIAQGAKPGEGGQLPGYKVSEIIAKTRYTTPGVTLISPPPHHDIYSIEDLAQLIFDLKNANPRARISVKLVSEIGVGTVAAGVAKSRADMILISGGDGGTGASPRSSIMHAGLPWELGLSEAHQTLVLNDLRSRVRLQTDGQMRTGRDVAIAAMLGAEEYGFCTSALVAMGCVMLRHCHLNNCAVGIATQDRILEDNFRGKVEYLIRYFHFVAEELREIMANMGAPTVNDLIGQTDRLKINSKVVPWKAKGIDYSKILYKPAVSENVGIFCQVKQDHAIGDVMDVTLINLAEPALKRAKEVKIDMAIANTDRAVGAMLSGEVSRRCGEDGLQKDAIHCKFKGIAGQSFGAFLAKGVTFELEGMANDYVGKGISGGKIIIYPNKESTYEPCENIIIGNTTFYGAISGEAYINGMAGERFCVRNSGLYAVVEGVGDHGCEYMTGGRVIVLGKTGRNFAAGMSGGIAYVYDTEKNFRNKYNPEMVILEETKEEDENIIKHLLSSHYQYTQSAQAAKVLKSFKEEIKHFVKIIPVEYKRVLEGRGTEERLESAEVSDG